MYGSEFALLNDNGHRRSSDGELEEQLLQAGNKLVDPPSSVDELLSLLDVKALIFCSSFPIFVQTLLPL